MFKKFFPLLTIFMVAFSAASRAEEADPLPGEKGKGLARADTIVITATKSEISARETGASLTVISEKEMKDRVNNTLADFIRTVPGVTVSSQSRFGGVTSAFIRGAKSENSVILVDGVRINDPTSPGKSANIGFMITDNVERIEVIRGSMSTLYGSDAMGGVINIITKKGSGDPSVTIKAEAGAYRTFKEMLGVQGGDGKAFYSFAVSKEDSQGYNATSRTPARLGPVDADGYESIGFSTRVGVKSFHESLLTLSARYFSGRVDTDDYDYGMKMLADDPNYKNESDQFTASTDYSIPLFKWWESRLTLSYMSLVRRIRDHADAYDPTELSEGWYKGSTMKAEWRNRFIIGSVDEILVGADYEREGASSHSYFFSPTEFEQKQSVTAAYAQNHLKLFDRIFIISGVRYTAPDRYSSAVSFSFSGSIILPYTETRLKGNYSTGFRTPTLYQTYTQIQNRSLGTAVPALSPERNASYDIGLEQPLFNEIVVAGVTGFWIDYDRPILFQTAGAMPPYGYYYNGLLGASSRGVEFTLTASPLDELEITGSYTFTVSRDNSTNREFILRPRHQAALTANYVLLERVNINGTLLYVGERLDASNRYINAYYRLDAAVTVRVCGALQVFVRGENLLNENYEEQLGYQTPGISFYGGFRGTL